MKRKQENVDFARTPTLHVSSSPSVSDRESESDLVSIWHARVCVWMQPYISAQATCGLWEFWLGLWANEHSCFELTVISWLQLRVSSCCWISWSRLSSRLHSFISCRTLSPGRRSPSQLQSASGTQSWCATDTTGSHKESHRWKHSGCHSDTLTYG